MTITYTYGNHMGTSDLTLVRDAAGVLARRNGDLRRVDRLYSTYTDAASDRLTSPPNPIQMELV